VCIATLSVWFKLCHEIEKKFESFGLSDKEIAELSFMVVELVKRREEPEERFGEGVISLVEREQFRFKLIYDLKRQM
jgi:hypothetical protein